jgi:ceramide glucosyltransferase
MIATVLIVFVIVVQLAACLFSAAVMIQRARPVALVDDRGDDPLTCIVAIAHLSLPEAETALGFARCLPAPHRLIYCAERADEPAARHVAAGLVALGRADDPRITLLTGCNRHSANPKLDNLAKGYAAATTDKIVLFDGNLAVTADVAARIHAVWPASVMAVSTAPVAVAAQTIWAHAEAAMINLSHARWMLAGDNIGIENAHGKLLGLRKSWLEQHGGYAALAQYRAEDNALSMLVARLGGRLRLTRASFDLPLGARGLRQVLLRNLRWRRIRATDRPLVYLAESCNALWSLVVTFACCALAFGWPVWPLVLALFIAWQAIEGAILAASGLGWSWRAQLGIVIRDITEPFLWVLGWFPITIGWRAA